MRIARPDDLKALRHPGGRRFAADLGGAHAEALRPDAEHREQAVRLPVDMRRIAQAAVPRAERGQLVERIARGVVDQEDLLRPGGFAVRADDLLDPENLGPVFNRGEALADEIAEIHRGSGRREEADHMDVLAGRDLHPRQKADSIFLRRRGCGRAVLGGVVVGQGDEVEAAELRHPDQVLRGRGAVPARGKAGVDVQVGPEHGRVIHSCAPILQAVS